MVALATPSASSFSVSNSDAMAGISAMRSASTSTRTKLRPSALRPSPQIDSSSDSFAGASSFGLSSASATRGVADDAARELQHLRPHRQRVLLARERERRFGVRAGDGGELGHRSYSSRFSCASSCCVHLAVDVALQDLRRAGNREVGDRVAQLLLRTLHFLLDLGLGRGDDAVGFRLGIDLRLLDRVAS